MAIAVNSTKEALAAAYASLGTWVSLHTADPGTTGASEATGGTPPYTRKQTTWSAGASDGIYSGSAVTFDVPAGTYAWAGLWSAASGGTFVDKVDITNQTLAGQGQVVITPTYTQS